MYVQSDIFILLEMVGVLTVCSFQTTMWLRKDSYGIAANRNI